MALMVANENPESFPFADIHAIRGQRLFSRLFAYFAGNKISRIARVSDFCRRTAYNT
jgi:hypothetical protein